MEEEEIIAAREKIIQSVIRLLSSERGDQNNPHWEAEIEYCHEMIAEAARELADAVS